MCWINSLLHNINEGIILSKSITVLRWLENTLQLIYIFFRNLLAISLLISTRNKNGKNQSKQYSYVVTKNKDANHLLDLWSWWCVRVFLAFGVGMIIIIQSIMNIRKHNEHLGIITLVMFSYKIYNYFQCECFTRLSFFVYFFFVTKLTNIADNLNTPIIYLQYTIVYTVRGKSNAKWYSQNKYKYFLGSKCHVATKP